MNTAIGAYAARSIRSTPLAAGLALAAIAAQITYPLVSGGVRDTVTFLVVALLAAACVAHARVARGTVWAATMIAVTAGIGLTAEIIGTRTGMPFGCYAYALDRIGPAVATVPVVVPLAWTAGLYPVWRAASAVARRVSTGFPVRPVLTVAGVVGWDFYLDPQMVADGQWEWCSAFGPLPGLDGIPWTNYVGWVLVASLMAGAMELLDRVRTGSRSDAQPTDGVPYALFLWTWLGSSLAHAVFLPDLGWSALYGLIAMGVVGVPFLVLARRPERGATDGNRDTSTGTRRPVH